MRRYLLNPSFVFAMAVWAALLGTWPSNALALPSESLSVVQPLSTRDAQIENIMAVLSRPEAQLHLRLMGLNESGVKETLLKLDDEQLAQVADKADAVKAGGEVLGIVIAVLLIVLLLVLILNLSNKKVEIKDVDKK